MQTFLPFDDFFRCGEVLDRSRLNKQILETRQIMNVLWKKATGQPVKGWANHPAVTQWEGFEWALLVYGIEVHATYAFLTGKKHAAFSNMVQEHFNWAMSRSYTVLPTWIGHEAIHSSHRSRLLHKGTLDVLRKRVTKEWIKHHFNKELRTFTVADVQNACLLIDVSYNSVLAESHYDKFGWDETPGDDYVWPKTDVCEV